MMRQSDTEFGMIGFVYPLNITRNIKLFAENLSPQLN